MAHVAAEHVIAAIAEHDTLGRDAFLALYGFRPAKSYFLNFEGNAYDSKAIYGVAHRYLPGGAPLKAAEFVGGAATVAVKLGKLGFSVAGPFHDADWSRDEHILALELYLRNPASPPGKGSAEVRELSALLNKLGERLGVVRSDKFRNANGVYMKMMNFRRLDPAATNEGKVGLQQGSRLEAIIWEEFFGKLELLRLSANAIRQAIGDQDVQLPSAEDWSYEAEEGGLVLRLHMSRERDRKLVAMKKRQVLAAGGALVCEVCDFDFAERYGSLGQGFIEVHHRKPVSTLTKGEKTRLDDLALVCANCHRMLHAGGRLLGVEDLTGLIKTA